MAHHIEFSDRTKILLILSILEQGEQTGFSLIRMMELKREFAFVAEEGMLYPLLHEMQQRGLITSYEKQTDAGLRIFYRVRRQGINLLSYLKQLYPSPIADKVGGGACAKSADNKMAR